MVHKRLKPENELDVADLIPGYGALRYAYRNGIAFYGFGREESGPKGVWKKITELSLYNGFLIKAAINSQPIFEGLESLLS